MYNEICSICPRNCNINRTLNNSYCGAKELKVAKVMHHFWEEPCISGTLGSGAIFFSHCNLKCIYCQNAEISNLGYGKSMSIKELAGTFEKLQDEGVHNINLVTPTHYASEIMQAIDIFKPKIPVVYNTGGYEKKETILQLKNYIDIYLCDFKYFSNELALNYSKAPNYFECVTSSLLQMRKNQPQDVFDSNGIMQKGIIIRHLVLPTHTSDSIKILEWIYENMGKDTIISLMSQYTPYYKAKEHEILKNKIKPLEYKRVLSKFLSLGFTNGYSQEKESASCEFIPDFKSN